MSPDSDSVEKFFHEASVKKILVLVRNMGFEGFWQNNLSISVCLIKKCSIVLFVM